MGSGEEGFARRSGKNNVRYELVIHVIFFYFLLSVSFPFLIQQHTTNHLNSLASLYTAIEQSGEMAGHAYTDG